MAANANFLPHAKRALAAPHALAGLVVAILLLAPPLLARTPEGTFMKENAAAMDRMMKGMSVKPSGDIDADFVNMMEPHHQGAIDMAVLELQFGKNVQLRRIAQEIIVDQQQEISAMRLALGRALPNRVPAPTSGTAARQTVMSGMTMH
jgi:Domain of unknown function (DUF305)